MAASASGFAKTANALARRYQNWILPAYVTLQQGFAVCRDLFFDWLLDFCGTGAACCIAVLLACLWSLVYLLISSFWHNRCGCGFSTGPLSDIWGYWRHAVVNVMVVFITASLIFCFEHEDVPARSESVEFPCHALPLIFVLFRLLHAHSCFSSSNNPLDSMHNDYSLFLVRILCFYSLYMYIPVEHLWSRLVFSFMMLAYLRWLLFVVTSKYFYKKQGLPDIMLCLHSENFLFCWGGCIFVQVRVFCAELWHCVSFLEVSLVTDETEDGLYEKKINRPRMSEHEDRWRQRSWSQKSHKLNSMTGTRLPLDCLKTIQHHAWIYDNECILGWCCLDISKSAYAKVFANIKATFPAPLIVLAYVLILYFWSTSMLPGYNCFEECVKQVKPLYPPFLCQETASLKTCPVKPKMYTGNTKCKYWPVKMTAVHRLTIEVNI